MKELVILNRKEQRRLVVLNQAETGKMSAREAAEVLELSLRHVRRILAAYRKESAQALAYGKRGKKPHNAVDASLKKQVLELAQSIYAGCNTQRFTELLTEREGITVSRSLVRLILLEAGIRSLRKRRPPKHRSRRERYPQVPLAKKPLQPKVSWRLDPDHPWRRPFKIHIGRYPRAKPVALYSSSFAWPESCDLFLIQPYCGDKITR